MLRDKKPRLGKGLGALIPDLQDDKEGVVSSQLQELPIDSIVPNEYQPRMRFNQQTLQELAASIQQHGVAQPIVVRKKGDNYELIAGERRWRACQMLELSVIPAIVRDFSDDEALQIAIIENIQREDINPIEEAKAYEMLIKKFGYKQEELAQKLGKSRPAITNSLRLLDLPDEILNEVIAGNISGGHARTLLGLPVNEQRMELLHKIKVKQLSVRQTEEAVKNMLQLRLPKEKKVDPVLEETEKIVQEKVWNRFSLQGTAKKGKLVFSYKNEKEKEQLFQILGIQ